MSKLRGVLECFEDSECHEVLVCRKVFERFEVHFVDSQILWDAQSALICPSVRLRQSVVKS